MNGIAVDLHALTHRYPSHTVLSDVTLHIASGSRHAIIGPNGAGKSTLLGLIAGTNRPTSGTITFDGRPVTRLPIHRRAQLGTRRTWQHPAIIETLTALDNVALAITTPRLNTARRTAMQHLELAGLDTLAHIAAGQLSHAQRRVLELVTALAGQPRLLILDEPSAGLDQHAATELLQRLLRLSANVTVVFADHSETLVTTIADTVTVLRDGHITAAGPSITARSRPRPKTLPPDQRQPMPEAATDLRSALARLSVSNPPGRDDTHPVLRNLHLEVPAAEILAITGPDGSGRTTLINTLAGIHAASPTPHVALDGVDITHLGPAQRARLGLSTVLQGRPPIPSITVNDHLRMVTHPATALQHAHELAPWLADRGRQTVGTLSGGERQLLAITCAVARSPKVLLLDEPSEGLAPKAIEQLGTLLRRLANQQVAIVFTSSPASQLSDWATRTLHLRNGQIISP